MLPMKHMIVTLLQNHVFYVFSIVIPIINMNKFTCLKWLQNIFPLILPFKKNKRILFG
jgi:hypothetical protein